MGITEPKGVSRGTGSSKAEENQEKAGQAGRSPRTRWQARGREERQGWGRVGNRHAGRHRWARGRTNWGKEGMSSVHGAETQSQQVKVGR